MKKKLKTTNKNYFIFFLNFIQSMESTRLDEEKKLSVLGKRPRPTEASTILVGHNNISEPASLDDETKKEYSIYVKPGDDYLITVNVSGEKIQVYKSTLLRAPYFHNLLDGPFSDPKDRTEIVLDMNPKWFHICLDRMRYGNIPFNRPSYDRYPALRYAAESLGLNFLTEEQEADKEKFKQELQDMKAYGPTSLKIAERLVPGDQCSIFCRDREHKELKYAWKEVEFYVYSKFSGRLRFDDCSHALKWKELYQGQLRIDDEEKLQEILARSIVNINKTKYK